MLGTSKFKIGALYPTNDDGSPNIILSSGYKLLQEGNSFVVAERKAKKKGSLSADLLITTEPVRIKGLEAFTENWLKPQLLAKTDETSIFRQYWRSITEKGWGNYPNNLLLEALGYLGYRGYGWDKAAENTGFWAENSTKSGPLYDAVRNLDNYTPELLWQNVGTTDVVASDFDTQSLLDNLTDSQALPAETAPLWYPAMLYTYGRSSRGTSYPGPVLMIRPGEKLKLKFENDIWIPGLTEEQNQQASLIENSSYGLNGGSTAGGVASTNFHMHGGHVNPSGFGDNVVSRYTSGQDWTTDIEIPEDHGIGSYWYHPHYHPAVNTQVYGGLSGFMQVGNPLQKIPGFEDVPRNLAVIKTMQIGANPGTGAIELAAVNGNILGTDSLAPNRASMFTVNGAYMPEANVEAGGWQSLTLSNQDNNYYMNIAIRNLQADGTWADLPLFIYGEDGHQYPQIRQATDTVIGYAQDGKPNASGYSKASNLISLSPGKRVDLLFYLPSGKSEIVSTYSFKGEDGKEYKINNLRFASDQYAELSSENTDPRNPNSGPGPLAKFFTKGNTALPSTTRLNKEINKANRKISVQKITPSTRADEYDPDAIPSINLYQKGKKGGDVWKPIREREFNYSILQLVGPENERDIPTQQALADMKAEGTDYQTYTFLPPEWLGYDNPDLINDHVFPNGPLIIAQLGTMEEWSLKNWNWGGPTVPNGGYLVGHPFHIHVNDYQVKDSDTELRKKRNLEDVTMLNSSGYKYADANGIQEQAPLAGTFVPIGQALEYGTDYYNELATTGYNDTTIRMLFQDFLGTYVHHCHLLEHEDAGMMQVVTVIENTDSSWILPAQGLQIDDKGLRIREANSLEEKVLELESFDRQQLSRGQVGDLTGDFIQDIILATKGKGRQAGQVLIYDGLAFQHDSSAELLSQFSPYKNSSLAPWAFNVDFTGDGHRELVTGGYATTTGTANVKLGEFDIIGWQGKNKSLDQWNPMFRYRPWSKVKEADGKALNSALTSFTIGDFNLDNFDDYAVAYFVGGNLRVRILDGASVALLSQTGQYEGGYLPDTSILADMEYADATLANTSSIVLTTGFNGYAQSAIENLIVTATDDMGHGTVLTFQLDAGHFIATGTDGGHGSHAGHAVDPDHADPGMSSLEADSTMPIDAETDAAMGSGMEMPDAHAHDCCVINLPDGALPIHLSDKQHLSTSIAAATPTFGGVLGQGGLLVGDRLVISQGATADGFTIGNRSSSDQLTNTTQDLAINLNGVTKVDRDDLTGIITTTASSMLAPEAVDQRINLAMLSYQAYTNSMVKPSDLAGLAAGMDGGALSAQGLVDDILAYYSAQVISFYGGPLNSLTTTQIAQKAYKTIYNRKASQAELAGWEQKVRNGLTKEELPLAILQSTAGKDRFHVGLLSAATLWSHAQWGTSAVVDGSFGQGFQAESGTFQRLSQGLFRSRGIASWQQADEAFSRYRDQTMNALDGTPVSDTGFF
jgi:FtsP/CotA-like multicopper oxidase with cupredoxin domain